nr:hypothetical protein GCM10020093_002760 [Planobispora longispora]
MPAKAAGISSPSPAGGEEALAEGSAAEGSAEAVPSGPEAVLSAGGEPVADVGVDVAAPGPSRRSPRAIHATIPAVASTATTTRTEAATSPGSGSAPSAW